MPQHVFVCARRVVLLICLLLATSACQSATMRSGNVGVGQSAADIAVTLDDLDRKLVSFSTELPREARWEIDRQRRELTDSLSSLDVPPLAERTVKSIEQVATAIDRLAPSVEAAARTAERTPDILDTEGQAAVDMIDAELTRTITFAQHERIAAFAYLTDERRAASDDLHRAIGDEQQALGTEIDQLSIRMVDHAMDRMERFVWQVLARSSAP